MIAAWLVALLLTACGPRLPAVPPFEQLGFADALDVVQRQVRTAYEKWEEEPLDAGLNGRLGMLLSAYARNSAAEIFYRRAQLLAPDEFRWVYYLAIALRQSGRYAESVEMFRKALAIEAEHEEARLELAWLLLQINHTEQSEALYRDFTADFPSRVEGWLGLGRTLDRKGDLEGAAAALERARMIGPQYGEVHFALAGVLAAMGDQAGADRELAAFERTAGNLIHTQDPLKLQVIRLNASDAPLMTRADYQIRSDDFDGAIASLRAVLAINPTNQDAWSGIIFAQAEQGQIDEAGDTYRAALAAGISYIRMHLYYGRALLEQARLEEARAVIGKAIELDPRHAEASMLMGELEMHSGNEDAAAELFRRSLATRPNDAGTAFLLARSLNAIAQFEEAVALLEPLESNPSDNRPAILRELALAYYGLERKEDAFAALKRGRDAASSSADAAMVEELDTLLARWQAERVE